METDLAILVRLLVAMVLSGAIGFEREYTGKAAGLRTHMLVAIGAALFVSLGDLFAIDANVQTTLGPEGDGFRVQIDPIRTVEAVVTGVSFLGAGTIFVSGRDERVKGLTTAASIWIVAAVGIAAGLERYILAFGTSLLALLILHVLNRLEKSSKKRTVEPTE